MRLVTLNTWKGDGDYPRRLKAMAKGLASLSPDLIALQEDVRTEDGRIHTAQTLAQALGLNLYWLPARAKRRKVGTDMQPSTSGLAVLSREPVADKRVVKLPEDPRDGQRLAQCIRLPYTLGGGWLINLHLTHLPDRPELRQMQLWCVINELSAWATDERWLVCGDFNAGPLDPEIASCMWPNGPLHDAFGRTHKVTYIDSKLQGHNLDQIFWRTASGQEIEVRQAWVALQKANDDNTLASDHFAVCVDIS